MKEFKMNRIGLYSTFALVCIMFISCGSHMQSISMPDGWHELKQDGYVGIADKDGNIIIPSIYTEVLWHYGYFKVRLGNKYGMLNVYGAEVIPPIYENVWVNKINNNYFCVQKNGHYITVRGNTSNSSQINRSTGAFNLQNNNPEYQAWINYRNSGLPGASTISFDDFIKANARAAANGYQIGNSSGSSSSTSSNNSTQKTHKCGLCNGTGRVVENNATSFGNTKYCSECGKTVPDSHYHTTCPSCKGKGWW